MMACQLVGLFFLRCLFFFFNATATTEIYTLSLHDALPILYVGPAVTTIAARAGEPATSSPSARSEEHTSELQSQFHLVCRLLLEKKKTKGSQPREGKIIELVEVGGSCGGSSKAIHYLRTHH